MYVFSGFKMVANLVEESIANLAANTDMANTSTGKSYFFKKAVILFYKEILPEKFQFRS